MNEKNPPLNKIRHTGDNTRGGLSLADLIGRPFLSEEDAIAAFLGGNGNNGEARAAAEGRLEEDRRAHKQGKGAKRYAHLDLAEEIALRLMGGGESEYQAVLMAAAEAQAETGKAVSEESIKTRLKRSKTN